jgi:transcriptional regulator with XRE-family HTH domain
MKDYTHLGKYLKQCREDKPLTQANLSKQLKIHPQYISNWERGQCPPPDASLSDMITLLKINKEKLIDAMLRDSKHEIESKVGIGKEHDLKKLSQLEPQDFFKDLLKELENRKKFLKKEDSAIIYCGLKFLLSESKLRPPTRDIIGIKKTWHIVKPILEKYDFLNKFQGAEKSSSRLRIFITGSL